MDNHGIMSVQDMDTGYGIVQTALELCMLAVPGQFDAKSWTITPNTPVALRLYPLHNMGYGSWE